MNTFQILESIMNEDNKNAILSESTKVYEYADNAFDIELTPVQAEMITLVGCRWLHQMQWGNGEWSRYRHEAIAALDEE